MEYNVDSRVYEVGDHVIVVKPDDAESNNTVGWNNNMDELVGFECEITEKLYRLSDFGDYFDYTIRPIDGEVSGWHWVADFLQPIESDQDFDVDANDLLPLVWSEL